MLITNLSAKDGVNYLNQGNTAFLKGNFVDAMKLYSKAGQTCIDETDKIDNNKALVFAKRGKYALAIERLTQALEYNPNNGNAYYNRAILHVILNAYKDAISDFEKAQFLGINSDHEVDYNIAIAYYLNGDIDKAKSLLSSSSISSTDERIPYLQGLISYSSGEYQKASNAFDQAATIQNSSHIRYAQGLAHYYAGNKEKGISILDNLQDNDEFKSSYKSMLANLAYEANDIESAEAYYTKVLEDDKTNSASLTGLGNIALIREQKDQAIKYFQQAVKFDSKNTNALNSLGHLQFLDTKYQLSISTFDKSLALEPNSSVALYGKALAAMHIPDPYTCLEQLAKINKSDLDPMQVEKVVLLESRALGICNKKEQAVKLLKKYRSIAQDKKKIKTLLAYYYLRMFQYRNTISNISIGKFSNYLPYLLAGHASLHSGKHADAYRYYRKAYNINKENPDVLMGAALSMMEIKMRDQSKRVIDSLGILYPDNYYVFNSKGIIYKDLGLHYKKKNLKAKANEHFETSAKAFERAIQIRPALISSFNNNLGLTYFHRDDLDSALNLFKSSKRLASVNNRALIDISIGNYNAAINRLDSLNKDFIRKNKVANSKVKANLALARKKAPMDNNYKFITYYFLHQDNPDISKENPFKSPITVIDLPLNLKPDSDFILEYSDIKCEKDKRERKKKNRKKLKFRVLKKDSKVKCPTFKT